MSGLGGLPGPIGIGKGAFGRTAGPSMMANLRAVQSGSVFLESEEASRDLKEHLARQEEKLEAKKAAIQGVASARRDAAGLPAVQYETTLDAVCDAVSYIKIQADARDKGHEEFRRHVETTKEDVEAVRKDILDAVKRGIEDKLVGAVNTLTDAISGDKTSEEVRGLGDALEKVRKAAEAGAKSAQNLEAAGLVGKLEGLDQAVKDVGGIVKGLQAADKTGDKAGDKLAKELAQIKTLLGNIPTSSGLGLLLRRNPEENSGVADLVRAELTPVRDVLTSTSSDLRSLLERRPESTEIATKLDAFIKGHTTQGELELEISALKSDLREAHLVQEKKLLEQKLEFQQKAMTEGIERLQAIHKQEQLQQTVKAHEAEMKEAQEKIKALEALVLDAETRAITAREKMTKDHGKEIGRMEAQLAAAAEKIKVLEQAQLGASYAQQSGQRGLEIRNSLPSPSASTSAGASSSPQRPSHSDALMRPPPTPGHRRESNDSEQRDPKRPTPYESPFGSRAPSVVSDTSAEFAPIPEESFAPRPLPVPAGTVAVRSPLQMATPVEFVATGGLLDGEIADSVCASTVDAVGAKIAEWQAKSKWEYPKGKKTLCIYVRGMKVAAPKWPTNNYHRPDNANPEFACPLCLVNRVPCVWPMKGAQSRVLPLPPSSRVAGATPQTPGFYIRQ